MSGVLLRSNILKIDHCAFWNFNSGVIDMLKFLQRFGEAAIFLIVLYYIFIVLVLILATAKFIRDFITLRTRLREIKRLRGSMSYDVFSVEGEVTGFTEKKLGRMDTKYDVTIKYTVDNITYYKEIVLHNRGSLRVGHKIILLCDDNDHSNAVVQDGSEEESLKGLAFAMAVEIGIAIYTIILLILDLTANLAQ